MRNILSQKIQTFFVFHQSFLTLLLVILLLVLSLCVFEQWYLLFMLVFMTIFFSISELLFSTMYHINRNSGSDDYYYPFTYIPTYRMLESWVDPCTSRSEQEGIERQEEDFKPFVFKHHPVDSGYE
jgi:hypothetical protein